jgi:hypothetical protein
VGDTESTAATFPDGDGVGGLPGWDQVQDGFTDGFLVKIAPAFNPGEASAQGMMTASKGLGSQVEVDFSPACAALDHAVFWGDLGPGPNTGPPQWTDAACGLGVTGSAAFDPGLPSAGLAFGFVVVGQTAAVEGSYGESSSGSERPEASGIGDCDRPQALSDTCP